MTTTTATNNYSAGSWIFTRTYNSDGTLQKIHCPNSYHGGSETHTFTWENGKEAYNYDIYNIY
jgi:hypothetical protein